VEVRKEMRKAGSLGANIKKTQEKTPVCVVVLQREREEFGKTGSGGRDGPAS
jgi:hypothetical protein